MSSVIKRDRSGETRNTENKVTRRTRQRLKLMQLQVKDLMEPPEGKEDKEVFFPRAFREIVDLLMP